MINSYNIISYPFKIKDKTIYIDVTDISTNIRIQQDFVKSVSTYNYKTLKNGQTPEVVAYEQYGNVKYHYLVMLANEMYDWRECYPLTEMELDSYVSEKYTDPNGVHHYENVLGVHTDKPDGAFTIPVTNYDYEYELNEAKRLIKVIKTEYSNTVVEMLKRAIQS